jgi:hypothetical protein
MAVSFRCCLLLPLFFSLVCAGDPPAAAFDFVLPSSVAVTEAEIKRLFRKFKKLDVDKSGQLTPFSELRSV